MVGFTEIHKGSELALVRVPEWLSQKINERAPHQAYLGSPGTELSYSGVFPVGIYFHWVGICVTQGDFKMLYLET